MPSPYLHHGLIAYAVSGPLHASGGHAFVCFEFDGSYARRATGGLRGARAAAGDGARRARFLCRSFRKLLPTVVNIATTQTLKANQKSPLADLPPDSQLNDFFRKFLGPKDNLPRHVTSLAPVSSSIPAD